VNPATDTSGSMAFNGVTASDSVVGAGTELLIVQQGGSELTNSRPFSCPCAPDIIGQSGGHSIRPAESLVQDASEADGASSDISTKHPETILYQTPIAVVYAQW
jgi:hypothetical protein